MVSLPDLRQQPVRARHQQQGLQQAGQEQGQAAPEPRGPGPLPARVDLQARDRDRRARRQEDHARRRRSQTKGYLTARRDASSTTGTAAASGPATSTAASATRATRSSSRSRGMLGIDRLALLGEPVRVRRPDRDRPARRGRPASCPTNEWKQATLGAPIFAGETYQAGIGQGYDVVTPIQLINAYAALANGGKLYQPQVVREVVGPDGTVVQPVQAEAHPQARRSSRASCGRCARRRGARSLLRHTYNLVDMPIKVAGKSGTAEFGTRDSQGRLPYPLLVRRLRARRTRTTASFDEDRLEAGRPGLRLRLANDGQRRHRDREVLLPAPLRHQEGLPELRPPRARQLLPGTTGWA